MDRLDEIMDEVYEVERGKARMELYKEAYKIADERGDTYNQIFMRKEYIEEAMFYDDILPAYIVFPEMLKLYDKQVEKAGESDFEFSMLWQYKWILGNFHSFYQISLEQWEKMCEDFKRRCIEQGWSLRAYYSKRYFVLCQIDLDLATEAYNHYLNEKDDYLSDCSACEADSEIRYLLFSKKYEEANKLSRKIFIGNLRCSEVPGLTYGNYLIYHLVMGEIDRASDCCDNLLRIIKKKKVCTELLGKIMIFYSITDIDKAFAHFKKYLEWNESNKDPYCRAEFCAGTALMLQKIKAEKIANNTKTTIRMKVDNKFELYNESGVYDIDTLCKYFEEYAYTTADKFDKRNGNNNFSKSVKEIIEKGTLSEMWIM